MKVVIACGGSGGHLYPGLALASSLKEKGKEIEIIYVVSQKKIDQKILGKEKHVLSLPVIGMPSFFSWRFPLFVVKFFVSLWVCLLWMKRLQPDIFVGFGGYVSGPVILAGILLKKPTMIHEENVMPGRANIFLSRWVNCIGVAFEDTKKCFHTKRPIVHVGNPLRRDLANLSLSQARRAFGLEEGRFTLLVSGGSQGSHRLNRTVLETLERMPEEERSEFQVIHLAGEKDGSWVEASYQKLAVPARVYSFLEKMGEAYSAADLVIARGGAMTLAEIGHFRKSAILIPLVLARNHQTENVKYLSRRGACILFEEEKTMTDAFLQEILALKKDASRREALSEKLASFYPNGGAERIAEEIFRIKNFIS